MKEKADANLNSKLTDDKEIAKKMIINEKKNPESKHVV